MIRANIRFPGQSIRYMLEDNLRYALLTTYLWAVFIEGSTITNSNYRLASLITLPSRLSEGALSGLRP